ncbi:MAG: GspE/PulE family protein [Planctomycetota bacterium]|jgi:general secretion pathway protein E
MPLTQISLLDTLVEQGVLPVESTQAFPRDEAALTRALLREESIPSTAILQVVGERLGMDIDLELDGESVSEAFTNTYSFRYATAHGLAVLNGETAPYRLVLSDPYELNVLDEISARLQLDLIPVLAPPEVITDLINAAYQQAPTESGNALDDLTEEEGEEALQELDATEDLLDITNRTPIVKLVNSVLADALKKRATDVHFQPQVDGLQIRARIDGLLYDLLECPSHTQDAILSRIKVMGSMDIAERRKPQDGRATLRFAGREVDMRISVVPTSHGEQAVLRLLDRATGLFELKELGLADHVHDSFHGILNNNHGIILITGPTGSGKTTTLYAALSQINSRDKHIVTIEDPIEYRFTGISQMQVLPKKDLTFANSLRAIVRQDPDVIMVGEIRDHETASIAVQSSLTGHLIFSTLHTNDAPGAVARLLDLGVEPYLISSSLLGVLAQRLVRRVCPHCAVSHTPNASELSSIGLQFADSNTKGMKRGVGCEACFDHEYFGRTGIHELLSVTDEIRRMITARTTAAEIRELGIQQGMKTLRMDGAQKVLQGITTPDEVLRVTQMDVE